MAERFLEIKKDNHQGLQLLFSIRTNQLQRHKSALLAAFLACKKIYVIYVIYVIVNFKFQIMRFSRSFCLLLTEFFLSIRTEISVRSLPLCQILQIFTINFQRYFRSKYKFCKIFECTRSLDLHLHESGVLAQAACAKKLFQATLNHY